MSAAVAGIAVPQPKPLELVPSPAEAKVRQDEHPLLPVVIAGFVALVGAVGFVGTIVALIALRYSGVLAQ